MKSLKLVAVGFVFAAFFGINAASARAQQAAQGKVAIIESAAFADSKQGIQRIVVAINRVEGEFQPRRAELQGLQTRYNQLLEEIKKLQGSPAVDPNSIQQKADQAEQLKKELERKYQDAQDAYGKRMAEVMRPLQQDVSKQLEAYAKQRGIAVVMDASQNPSIIYVDGAADITADFVKDYNQRNPANAAAVSRP
ncbi:MAG: OmpH family outer membrane protein [Pyrinomonadaceae bacterium]